MPLKEKGGMINKINMDNSRYCQIRKFGNVYIGPRLFGYLQKLKTYRKNILGLFKCNMQGGIHNTEIWKCVHRAKFIWLSPKIQDLEKKCIGTI
jgi:hypothetical protein